MFKLSLNAPRNLLLSRLSTPRTATQAMHPDNPVVESNLLIPVQHSNGKRPQSSSSRPTAPTRCGWWRTQVVHRAMRPILQLPAFALYCTLLFPVITLCIFVMCQNAYLEAPTDRELYMYLLTLTMRVSVQVPRSLSSSCSTITSTASSMPPAERGR